MKAVHGFIVTPKEKRYKPADSGGFVTSSSIEFAKDVDRRAIVVETPINYNGDIQIGDEVFIHHNVFRLYYNQLGKATNSRGFLYDSLFVVIPEEIFAYKKQGKWFPHLDYCFVSPVKEDTFSEFKHVSLEHIGKVIMSNQHPEQTLIAFTPDSEYEVDFTGETLYRMRNKDIYAYLNES